MTRYRRNPRILARNIKTVAAMQVRLEETDDLCKEIAIEITGRPDTAARMFKRITGKTMEEYRESIRQRRQS
jgi:methylphosphotriester-DNA--protein-cysteine methyltransferase